MANKEQRTKAAMVKGKWERATGRWSDDSARRQLGRYDDGVERRRYGAAVGNGMRLVANGLLNYMGRAIDCDRLLLDPGDR